MGSRLNYLDAHSAKRRRQIHSPASLPFPHTREHTQSVWNSAPLASLLIRVPCSSATLRLSPTMFFFYDSLLFLLPAIQ